MVIAQVLLLKQICFLITLIRFPAVFSLEKKQQQKHIKKNKTQNKTGKTTQRLISIHISKK